MNKVAELLKNKVFLISFGYICSVVIVFVCGKQLNISLTKQLIAVMSFLVIGLILLLISQMKALRNASQLEKEIQAQGERHMLSGRPDKRAEIESLKKELTDAIGFLKKSKLSKKYNSNSALYALPWYMFIGPPAAGKTTAIINSGLEFPAGAEKKGVGGTRNCDWFFSNAGILLDTAGRYTVEEDDTDEWFAFLDILKKYRNAQPINGVLVGISISDIINSSVEQLDMHAKNIRNRIDELIKRLEIHFPVYIVFTKSDLLQGFVEFFENFSRKERGQIFGATFSKESQHSTKAQVLFENEFDLLVQSVNDFRLTQFSKGVKPENRASVYVFALEFGAIKEKISVFLEKVFHVNPYLENPLFRGFYFTSGTQEGLPLDNVIQKISQKFELPSGIMESPIIEKKSYFLTQLFTDVIIPDKNLIAKTSKAAFASNLLKLSTIIASIVLLTLFIIGISQSFVRSKLYLNSLSALIEKQEKIDWSKPSEFVYNVEALDELNQAIANGQQKKNRMPILSLGMYRGNSSIPYLKKVYDKTMVECINALFYEKIQQQLEQYTFSQNTAPGSTSRYLKTYLLLGKEKNRLEQKKHKVFLGVELIHLLQNDSALFTNDSSFTSAIDQLKPHVAQFITKLSDKSTSGFSNDTALLTKVRMLLVLNEKPSLDFLYKSLKTSSLQVQLKDFSLSEMISEKHAQAFESNPSVSGFFTKQGFDLFVKNSIRNQSISVTEDIWILANHATVLPAELKDQRQIEQELMRMYFDEYTIAWNDFISKLTYQPCLTIRDANERIHMLSDKQNSPIPLLLSSITEQTKFIPLSPQQEKKVSGSENDTVNQSVDTSYSSQRLLNQFGIIQSLSGTERGAVSEKIKIVTEKYMDIQTALEPILSDAGFKSMQCVSDIVQQGVGEIPEALKTIRRTLNEVPEQMRKNLFEMPVIETWILMCNQAQQYLNTRWESTVYNEYKRSLQNYYPFKNSESEVSFSDVKRFFDPNSGTFWTFIESELKPFIKTESWTCRTWEEHGISISSSTVAAIKKAEHIKKVFFQNELPIRFSLKPSLPLCIGQKKPYVNQTRISIDDNEYIYQMGQSSAKQFFWPSSNSLQQICRLELSIRDKEIEPEPLSFEGEWAFFRLLQRGRVEPDHNSRKTFTVYWTFEKKNYYAIQLKYTLQAQSENNPFYSMNELFKFSLSNKL